jgi:hypothetical protein
VIFIPEVKSSQAAKTSNSFSERAHTACSRKIICCDSNYDHNTAFTTNHGDNDDTDIDD